MKWIYDNTKERRSGLLREIFFSATNPKKRPAAGTSPSERVGVATFVAWACRRSTQSHLRGLAAASRLPIFFSFFRYFISEKHRSDGYRARHRLQRALGSLLSEGVGGYNRVQQKWVWHTRPLWKPSRLDDQST